MKTAEGILNEELSDSQVIIVESLPFFHKWIIQSMKEYAKQVSEQALKDAAENATLEPNGILLQVDKQSILETEIKLS